MSIMEIVAIPLWTFGGTAAIVGAIALAMCAFGDNSVFLPHPGLSRRQ